MVPHSVRQVVQLIYYVWQRFSLSKKLDENHHLASDCSCSLRLWSSLGTTSFPSNSIYLTVIFIQLVDASYATNVMALNGGTSVYLTHLLRMFDI